MDKRFKAEGYQIQPVDPATNIIVSLVIYIPSSLTSKAHTDASQAVKLSGSCESRRASITPQICLEERKIEY